MPGCDLFRISPAWSLQGFLNLQFDLLHQFWKILVISSSIAAALFSLSPSGTPITHMLDLSLLS